MNPDPVSPADRLVADLLAAAEDYDVTGCDRLFARAVAELDPVLLVREVTSPVLREAGNRWHRGEWSVVQEHLLSGVVRAQLSVALNRHLQAASGPAIVFTTLSGERHELGGLMGAYLAASRGFVSLWLGPDLPAAEISRFCGRRPVHAIALSLVTQPDVNDARGQLGELRAGVPAATEIWVAGQAANLLHKTQLPAGITAIPDVQGFLLKLAALETRIP